MGQWRSGSVRHGDCAQLYRWCDSVHQQKQILCVHTVTLWRVVHTQCGWIQWKLHQWFQWELQFWHRWDKAAHRLRILFNRLSLKVQFSADIFPLFLLSGGQVNTTLCGDSTPHLLKVNFSLNTWKVQGKIHEGTTGDSWVYSWKSNPNSSTILSI